jgi:Lon protease-like protein
MREMPLFPLSAVLLPHGRMPLQIFEQRYLDLVKDCMKSGEPFGVIWIRQGAEVTPGDGAGPDLGDYGTTAQIVDWDQLPNGLLGITIQGGDRFDLFDSSTRDNGLVVGQVALSEPPPPAAMLDSWQSILDVLRSLQTHPHVERLGLVTDYEDPWQVAYTLVQLLPLEESLKYELLGVESLPELMGELDIILNQISGEA